MNHLTLSVGDAFMAAAIKARLHGRISPQKYQAYKRIYNQTLAS